MLFGEDITRWNSTDPRDALKYCGVQKIIIKTLYEGTFFVSVDPIAWDIQQLPEGFYMGPKDRWDNRFSWTQEMTINVA